MAPENWFGFTQGDLLRKLQSLVTDLKEPIPLKVPQNQIAHIEDWCLARRVVPCLIGRTRGHPHIGDSSLMFSSELFYLNETFGFARSFSRWYRLGNQVPPSYWENGHPRQN